MNLRLALRLKYVTDFRHQYLSFINTAFQHIKFNIQILILLYLIFLVATREVNVHEN